MRAVRRETIRSRRPAQIIRIKFAVHKNFREFQSHRAAEIFGRFYLCYAREILPEIVHRIAARRFNDFLHAQALDIAYRFADLHFQRAFIPRHFRSGKTSKRRGKIFRFAVVKVRKTDRTFLRPPRFVGNAAYFSVDREIGGNRAHIAVQPLSAAKIPAAVPPLRHRKAQNVFARFQQIRYVVSLHLQRFIVGSPPRGEIIASHAHAVNFGEIQPERRGKKFRLFKRAERKFLFCAEYVRLFRRADKFTLNHHCIYLLRYKRRFADRIATSVSRGAHNVKRLPPPISKPPISKRERRLNQAARNHPR